MISQSVIEGQIFDVLRSKAEDVCGSRVFEGHVGFGLVPTNYESVPCGPVKRYVHRVFKTRNYRDWHCAAYKLYKFCESLPHTERMYIRITPKVLKMNDFEKGRTFWCGYVRFSNKADD